MDWYKKYEAKKAEWDRAYVTPPHHAHLNGTGTCISLLDRGNPTNGFTSSTTSKGGYYDGRGQYQPY